MAMLDERQGSRGPLRSAADFLARKGRRVWTLRVTAKRRIGPAMLRVEFAGADLGEMAWKSGGDLVLELPRVDGTVSRRHYTIRHHDAASATLAIDFVLHGEGASAEWLAKAGPGTEIEAAGPRGHTYLREADWHLFVGDETATPAILAMIENLPAGACATAVLECGSEADRLLPERTAPEGAKIVFIWCERGAAAPASNMLLCDALERLPLAAGRGHAYVLGETGKVRAIRHRLIARGLSKDRITCEGYWRPGRIGGHDHI